MQIKLLIILIIVFSRYKAVLSQESNSHILFETTGYVMPYQLNKPQKVWKLPKELVEISGLSYVDKHRLACIQDEKGTIYIFNTKKGKIEIKTVFEKKGDFEGIEIVEKDAWVLKSSGTLYHVKDLLKHKNHNITKYNTELTAINNTEGMGYYPTDRSLIIACKGYPYTDGYGDTNAKKFKALYRFDINSGKLDVTPFLLIELDNIKQYKDYDIMTRMGIELLAFFDASEGDVSFQPSGIAVHPQTGNLYVLASVGKTLAVFSEKGEMLALTHLKSSIHKQPEGICFSPDGTLYISNEGDDGKGTIMRFNKQAW